MSKETYTKDLHIYEKKPTPETNTSSRPVRGKYNADTKHFCNTCKDQTLLQHIQEQDIITTHSRTRYCVVLNVVFVLQLQTHSSTTPLPENS